MTTLTPDSSGAVLLRIEQATSDTPTPYETQIISLTRQAIDATADAAASHANTARALHEAGQASAQARHEAEQAMRRAQHDAQLHAIAVAAEMPVADMALQLVASLPVGMGAKALADEVAMRLAIVQAYRDGKAPPHGQVPAPPVPPAPPAPTPAAEPAPAPAPVPAELPMLTHAGFAQMRGANSFAANYGPPVLEELTALRQAGANMARVWFAPELERTSSGPVYLVPKHQIARLRQAAEHCRTIGLRMTLAMGAAHHSDWPWGDDARMTAFLDMWIALAREFKGDGVFAGFDIGNEPTTVEAPGNPGATGWTAEQQTQVARDWRELALACVGGIRAVDPQRLVVWQVGFAGDPGNFERERPLPFANVWESVHLYLPHSYTHHGSAELTAGLAIPKPIPTYTPEVQAIRKAAVETVMRWSERHKRGVFWGEFSAIRHVPGREQYIEDTLSDLTRAGHPYCYHDWAGALHWEPKAAQTADGSWEKSDDTPIMRALRAHWAP